MTTTTLEAAVQKAAKLPREAQDAIAREMLERVDQITHLRTAIDVGVRELDAGKGRTLDIEALIDDLSGGHGSR